MNDIATFIGTFFFINLFDIGITAQSQAGIKNPMNIPVSVAKIIFLGIIFSKVSSETKCSIAAEIIEPKSRNGKLSKKIDINTTEIL